MQDLWLVYSENILGWKKMTKLPAAACIGRDYVIKLGLEAIVKQI